MKVLGLHPCKPAISAASSYVHSVPAASACDESYLVGGDVCVIFEKQISNICSLIGETHDFVFVDGPLRCGPAKGMCVSGAEERDQYKERTEDDKWNIKSH